MNIRRVLAPAAVLPLMACAAAQVTTVRLQSGLLADFPPTMNE